MEAAQFTDLVTCLSGDRTPRVWSLLVTVFGELAQDEGAQISGALLRHLSDLIGFKPEAVRVALHRLRKDGWIESRRQGRNSVYFLTDWGRAQSVAASPRIYATGPMADRAWLVVHEPGQVPQETGAEAAWLTSNLLLTSRHIGGVDVFVTPVTETTPLPDWMSRKLCDDDMAELVRRLNAVLSGFDGQTDILAQLDPCQRAALRVLVVHDWRRIVLKTPRLPDFVFPESWAGASCRGKVARFLERLPRERLDVLEHSLAA